jgi:hypothetical protein
MAEFLTELRGLSEAPIEEAVAVEHIAMITSQVIVSPVHQAVDPKATVTAGSRHDRLRSTAFNRRRRIMFNSLGSSLAVKVIAASIALAAVVGTGAAAANSALPGSPLFGIDKAMEKIGIGNGGSAERTAEAQSLLSGGDVPGAAHAASEAIGALAGEEKNEQAQEALGNAAARIATVRDSDAPGGDAPGYAKTQALRDHVAVLLEAVSSKNHDEIVAAAKGFSEIAKGIGAPNAPETAPDDAGVQFGTPLVSTPPVSTPPVSAPPVSTPPVAKPPVSTPPVSTPVGHPPASTPPFSTPPVSAPPAPPVSHP